MVEHSKEHPSKQHERHSSKQEHGQAYGGTAARGGSGKYNWGSGNTDERTEPRVDPKDPMYDSGSEQQHQAKAVPASKQPERPAKQNSTG